jgi:hypothetical protein
MEQPERQEERHEERYEECSETIDRIASMRVEDARKRAYVPIRATCIVRGQQLRLAN